MDKTNWLILAGITTLWIIGAGGFYYKTQNLETLFLAINAFAVLIAVYIGALNAMKNTEYKKEEIEFRKTENAFIFLERWDSDLLKQARDFTREIKKEQHNLSPQQILKQIESNQDLERSVITIFNFFQDIYLSINHKRVNNSVLKRAFAEVYPSILTRFRPWINKLQGRSPAMIEDLESLNNLWR